MLSNDNLPLFKLKTPNYTIRMLLDHIKSESNEIPTLKQFTHFTLGCTYEDEILKVATAFDKFSDFFKESVTFQAETFVNLGSETQPLWGVSLNLGCNEGNIRAFFSEYFDPIMCKERNGILYLWRPREGSQKRCPHITIGSTNNDLEIAQKLLQIKSEFVFKQVDYKKIGRYDAHVIRRLDCQVSNKIHL